mgnify:CR=1 FL=1
MPGLQHRTFGILSLVGGRKLWRDFQQKARPKLDNPAGWAAAVEFVMSEQTGREVTQGSVAGYYEISLATLLPRIKRIKKTLQITGYDARYSPLTGTHIVFKSTENAGT